LLEDVEAHVLLPVRFVPCCRLDSAKSLMLLTPIDSAIAAPAHGRGCGFRRKRAASHWFQESCSWAINAAYSPFCSWISPFALSIRIVTYLHR